MEKRRVPDSEFGQCERNKNAKASHDVVATCHIPRWNEIAERGGDDDGCGIFKAFPASCATFLYSFHAKVCIVFRVSDKITIECTRAQCSVVHHKPRSFAVFLFIANDEGDLRSCHNNRALAASFFHNLFVVDSTPFLISHLCLSWLLFAQWGSCFVDAGLSFASWKFIPSCSSFEFCICSAKEYSVHQLMSFLPDRESQKELGKFLFIFHFKSG